MSPYTRVANEGRHLFMKQSLFRPSFYENINHGNAAKFMREITLGAANNGSEIDMSFLISGGDVISWTVINGQLVTGRLFFSLI